MFVEKLKFVQGYVKVKLTGYAPERFLNLCSSHNILIWNLMYNGDHYEFYISVEGVRHLKPILHKTKTRMIILERHGIPFFFHKYRKRKLFFGGILICAFGLYVMSLYIWNIEVNGNSHQTDSTIIKYLSENDVYHGLPKSKINCTKLEELLRSEFSDVIWASAKIKGTRLVIDLQENLINNQAETATGKDTPSDLIAEKEAQIYSILTRIGTPYVQKGVVVQQGDLLVEGKIPIYDDNGEIAHYQYCRSDADILGIADYAYEDILPFTYEDKVFTGEETVSFHLMLLKKQIHFNFFRHDYELFDTITEEYPLKFGENFYLPLVWQKETVKKYEIQTKQYAKKEAEILIEKKLNEFCQTLTQKGVQIIENSVIIVTEGKKCQAKGSLKVIEPIGSRQITNKETLNEEETPSEEEVPSEEETLNEAETSNEEEILSEVETSN
ncbi:sporulation protein YqfD [Lachnospiraceae bacterium ZAX-1]